MLLEVANLVIDLATPEGAKRVVNGGTFALDEGESLGVVGESGSGKTMTALALMGLTPEGARVSGSIRFEGRELVGLGEEAMRALRGDRIAMVFQEPMTALNPLHRGGAGAGGETARTCPPGRPGARRPRLSLRVVGRREAARDDRHGDRLFTPPRHRRRADDGPRRDRAGSDSRTD